MTTTYPAKPMPKEPRIVVVGTSMGITKNSKERRHAVVIVGDDGSKVVVSRTVDNEYAVWAVAAARLKKMADVASAHVGMIRAASNLANRSEGKCP